MTKIYYFILSILVCILLFLLILVYGLWNMKDWAIDIVEYILVLFEDPINKKWG